MPYVIIKRAIERRESLTAKYDHYIRMFSPHALGDSQTGDKRVLGFQYGGGRPGGLPAAGDWCFFAVDSLRDLTPNGDRWVFGTSRNQAASPLPQY
jgi:hypothetical protein